MTIKTQTFEPTAVHKQQERELLSC